MIHLSSPCPCSMWNHSDPNHGGDLHPNLEIDGNYWGHLQPLAHYLAKQVALTWIDLDSQQPIVAQTVCPLVTELLC